MLRARDVIVTDYVNQAGVLLLKNASHPTTWVCRTKDIAMRLSLIRTALKYPNSRGGYCPTALLTNTTFDTLHVGIITCTQSELDSVEEAQKDALDRLGILGKRKKVTAGCKHYVLEITHPEEPSLIYFSSYNELKGLKRAIIDFKNCLYQWQGQTQKPAPGTFKRHVWGKSLEYCQRFHIKSLEGVSAESHMAVRKLIADLIDDAESKGKYCLNSAFKRSKKNGY